ncbi:MAG TPA: hypothetical protein VNT27_03515 [Propionibacteriaceae bacterium]|nr:hypothetical protein [Propionibacteriaceae bacterium]
MSDLSQPTERDSGPDLAVTAQHADDIAVKSYTYLRLALVGLLIALGAAVLYQSAHQGSFLASVSAYYYTAAQAIFVGALIGMGASMIALKGRNAAEEIFLNLGGIFAAVVAIVPTSRGADYRTAVRACHEQATTLLTGRASNNLDCPTVLALEAATRSNIENNAFALLVVGILSLVAAFLFARRAKTLTDRWFQIGFTAALLVWAAAAASFAFDLDLLIASGHYVAAILLLVCVLAVAVAVANATRRRADEESRERPGPPQESDAATAGRAMFREPRQFDRYAWLAWVLLVGTGVGVVLWMAGVISLFWLEIFAALLFAAFWAVQTIEQLPPRGQQ